MFAHYILIPIFTVPIALYIFAVVNERCIRKQFLPLASPSKRLSSLIDDLFLPRLFLLSCSLVYFIITIPTLVYQNLSYVACVSWNIFHHTVFSLAKYALFIFLYHKQRVLQQHLKYGDTFMHHALWIIMHLLPVLGIGSAILTPYSFNITTNECITETTDVVNGLIALTGILDITGNLGMLYLFLGMIRRHMLSMRMSNSPVVKSNSADNFDERPKSGSVGGQHLNRQQALENIMELNKRSCVMCIVGFLITCLCGILLPKFHTIDYHVVMTLVACMDLMVDSTAMIMCSPQIWMAMKSKIHSLPNLSLKTADSSSTQADSRKNSAGQIVVDVQLKENPLIKVQVPPSP